MISPSKSGNKNVYQPVPTSHDGKSKYGHRRGAEDVDITNWPRKSECDNCEHCNAPGVWPVHLDKRAAFKSEDGSYQNCSGASYWEQTIICEKCRDPQLCECSVCWCKRKPSDEPLRENYTRISPEGIVTVLIPLHASDFSAEFCVGCQLTNPRAPHMPRDRLVCSDCPSHYCSLQCLEDDFPNHHWRYGCLANKGRGIMDYYKECERASGEQKVASAEKKVANARRVFSGSQQTVANARKAISAAQAVAYQAQQALDATMFQRWGECNVSCEDNIAVDRNSPSRENKCYRCPICAKHLRSHQLANAHMREKHFFTADNPEIFRELASDNCATRTLPAFGATTSQATKEKAAVVIAAEAEPLASFEQRRLARMAVNKKALHAMVSMDEIKISKALVVDADLYASGADSGEDSSDVCDDDAEQLRPNKNLDALSHKRRKM